MADQTNWGVKLPAERTSNARNLGGEKELVERLVLVARRGEQLVEVIDARWYMARRSDGASPVYCSVWVSGAASYAGHGRASGYGYCKQSAAFAAAIESAGISLQEGPSGRGMGAVREAMNAIADALGADNLRRII